MLEPIKPWNNDAYKERLKKRLAMEERLSQKLLETITAPSIKDTTDYYINLNNIENSNFILTDSANINKIKYWLDRFISSWNESLSKCVPYITIDLLGDLSKLADFISTTDEYLSNTDENIIREILDNPSKNVLLNRLITQKKLLREWDLLDYRKSKLEKERMKAYINDDTNKVNEIIKKNWELENEIKKNEKKVIKNEERVQKSLDQLENIDNQTRIDLKKDVLFYRDFADVVDGIDIIKPNNLSYKQLIKEIRDWIAHSRYKLCKQGIYINNPELEDQHWKDFECKIKRESLEKLTTILKRYKKTHYSYKIQDIDSLDFTWWIEKILKNIHLERQDNNGNTTSWLVISKNFKWMLRNFFKNHPLNKENLIFALDILSWNKKSTFNNEMTQILKNIKRGQTFNEVKKIITSDNKWKWVWISSFWIEYIQNYSMFLLIYTHYINNIQSSPRQTPSNQRPTEEHRRDAFAHWNYAILPWSDDILLWDYPADVWSWVWEEKVSLKTLYDECFWEERRLEN